ncbi:EAL domain-containing protein [candidate division KSB1 bacterium]|nr:EAL domain-containing protein [candidate division KSB1 bacterium]
MLNEPIKILLVEDDLFYEDYLSEIFAEETEISYELNHVVRIKDCVEHLEQDNFDVILIDLNLPDCTGLDTIYEIESQASNTPIIVLTEQDDNELAAQALQSGAQDYLVKGQIDRSTLERSIRYAIERNRLLEQLEESKRLQRHLAYHDALTILPNRHLLHDRLQQALAQSKRSGKLAALLFLDLDGFKRINDTLGHGIGDLLLKSVAKRLKTTVRQVDTVARLGGDEFTIVLLEINHAQDAKDVAQKILKVISQPYKIEEHELFVTASVGISIYPDDGSDIESLIRKADIAMYRAKGQGKNNYQVYNLSMDAKFFERLTLENSLRKAVENEELVAYYQPQVDLRTGEITGVEALVRWQHQKFGLVPPDKFIPLAEETGVILEIDEWMMKTACRQIKNWEREGIANIRVAVNLSTRQFRQKNLTEKVAQILNDSAVQPKNLCLEITENEVMHNIETTVEILQALKKMGVLLSLDDFGTGYSSLSYLKRFPIDILKIDRTFVNGIPSDRDDTAISTAIVVLAHSMELQVIAEGVEKSEQIAFLQSLQCDEIQGFYFSRPLNAETVTDLLKVKKRLFLPN